MFNVFFLLSLGPSLWHTSYPICGRSQQSPISIDVSQVVVNNSLEPFNFESIKDVTNLNMTLENNGHSGRYKLS